MLRNINQWVFDRKDILLEKYNKESIRFSFFISNRLEYLLIQIPDVMEIFVWTFFSLKMILYFIEYSYHNDCKSCLLFRLSFHSITQQVRINKPYNFITKIPIATNKATNFSRNSISIFEGLIEQNKYSCFQTNFPETSY